MPDYDYKEEVEKIKKEKNVTFYYDFCDDEKKRYSILPRNIKQIDELEKLLSEAINENYKNNQKEEFIKIISEIIDRDIKIENNKKILSISDYRSSLRCKTRGLYIIVN